MILSAFLFDSTGMEEMTSMKNALKIFLVGFFLVMVLSVVFFIKKVHYIKAFCERYYNRTGEEYFHGNQTECCAPQTLLLKPYVSSRGMI